MNSLWNKLRTGRLFKNGSKRLALSVVILCEVIAIAAVATFAWVETVSSIKITNEANTVGLVKNDTKYTDMLIGNKPGTINLLDYFESAGDMHLAPASSADGKTFYFPKVNDSTNFANVNNPTYNVYRKGNASDKNTTYLSVSFRLKADTNADFFFTSTPTITVADDIRVSVTAYTEGDNPEGKYDPATGKLISNTKIYANNASTTPVVNATDGATGATTVEKFTDHQKGKSSTYRLFAVGANETKIVTINVWLQKKTSDNDDLTTNMSAAQAITNLGITSSLTPRHVTLIPTPTWNNSSPTYYAWCYNATNGAGSRLYKLELDDNEHYSFVYNGTYQKTTFVRAVTGCTVEPGLYDSWPFSTNTNSNSDGYWDQTVDTTIPSYPVDPTYIIETIDGGSSGKSTGSWHDPAIVKVATCTGQSSWGTLTATSYVGTTTSTHVIETTNSSSNKHKDTVHAWPGKKIKLQATANEDYAFVGWFDNAEGTGNALDNDALNAPLTASEITYYAKFKETRKLTIYRYLDGSNVETACGTITINGTASSSGSSTYKVVDKGSSVTFAATAENGYTFEGFFTTADGDTQVHSPQQIDSHTFYYARFTTNEYNVKANAYYSTNNGSSYTAGDAGGTVTAGSATAGATSTASVKYKSTVNLVATPASGYEFVGWYSAASGGTELSTNTSYTYTLNTVPNTQDNTANVYARFIKQYETIVYITPRAGWDNNYYLRCYDYGGNNLTSGNNGFAQASYDGATGYYKVSFMTSKTGNFWAILSKNNNNNYDDGKYPSSGGYKGTIGNNYRFKSDQNGDLPVFETNRRCIWFIITEDWLKNNLNNDGDKMVIYANSTNTYMTKKDDYAYFCEYSSISGSIYFKQIINNNVNDKRHEWSTSVPAKSTNHSQFKETSYNAGSWQ